MISESYGDFSGLEATNANPSCGRLISTPPKVGGYATKVILRSPLQPIYNFFLPPKARWLGFFTPPPTLCLESVRRWRSLQFPCTRDQKMAASAGRAKASGTLVALSWHIRLACRCDALLAPVSGTGAFRE